MDYTGYTITTGFLAGDLFAESSDEGGTYDVNASAKRYAEMCQEALEGEFPSAKVGVEYQLNASGATPIPLQTHIITPDGMVLSSPFYGESREIADRVYEITKRIWQSWKWVVYEENEEA
jgi:hypothetical protein